MSPGLKQSYKDLVCTHYQTLHKKGFGKLPYQFPIAAITSLAAENDSVLSSDLSGGHMSKICFLLIWVVDRIPFLEDVGPRSCFLAASSQGPFPVSRRYFSSWLVVPLPSPSKPTIVGQVSHKFQTSLLSLSFRLGWQRSPLLRTHLIGLGPPQHPGYYHGLKVLFLNYICKVPSAKSSNTFTDSGGLGHEYLQGPLLCLSALGC